MNNRIKVFGVLVTAILFCSQCQLRPLPEKQALPPLPIESPSKDIYPPESPPRSLNDVEIKLACPDDLEVRSAFLTECGEKNAVYLECGDSRSSLFAEDNSNRKPALAGLKYQLAGKNALIGENYGIYREPDLPKQIDGKLVGGVTMWWGEGMTSTLRMNEWQLSPRWSK